MTRVSSAVRERLRLYLSFGRHETSEDVGELAAQIETVKPHLYVQETADMSEAARVGTVRHMNDALPRCRHQPSVAQATLERLRASSKGAIDPVFTVEERRLLIATPGLRWFTVEGYQPEELAALDDGCSRAHDPRGFERVTAMLLAADVEQAARLHGAGLEGFARRFVAPRNDRIVAGFEQLAGDLRVLLPDLLRRREIRVLARFGSSHLHIAERLAAQGLRMSTCGAPPLSLADEIIVRLTREPEARISLEESLRSLFWDTHEALLPKRAPYPLHVARVRSTLSDLGGAAGFVELVRRCRRQSHSASAFWETVRAAMLATAPP